MKKKVVFCLVVLFVVSCSRNDTKPQEINMVDLGLSVKWATCNIGASKPEEYGRYFAWGDVEGQIWNGSVWSGCGFLYTPYVSLDANGNLKPECDAAHVILGGNWRMPTWTEQQELIENCSLKWTHNYLNTGIPGMIFTSKIPGYTDKSIFLPAAGNGYDKRLDHCGEYGNYWLSTFCYNTDAWFLSFYSEGAYLSNNRAFYGRSIRPVSD